MHSQSSVKILALLVCVLFGGIILTGCEWDNSEDYELDASEDGSNPESTPGTPVVEEETDVPDPTVSGVVATTEAIKGAIVCLDNNENGICEDGEPQTRSDDQGAWSITLEDGGQIDGPTTVLVENDPGNTVLADSGEQVPWKFGLNARVEPIGEPIAGVFVSPLSTLVENERLSLPSRDQADAIQNIAGKIGTDVDILENYLDPPANSTPLEEDAYQRITRIVAVADQLATQVDANIPDEDRDNLPKKELDSRIFDKVSKALSKIADDVDRSLIETPNKEDFAPEVVITQPKYEEDLTPPNTEPPSPSLTELERRIANAVNDSPYFIRSGFETFPVNASRLYDFEFFENPLRPGQVYYEARQRIVDGVSGDEAILDLDIAVPRRVVDDPTIYFKKISEADCTDETLGFDCTLLRSAPKTVRALTWSGFSFITETIQIGHKGRQRALAISNLGDIVASSPSNGFASEMNFREFSLDGLDGRDVIYELTGIELPGTETWTYGPNAKAYTFGEGLISDIILSQWPAGGDGNLCDSPGLPDASITMSCNLVYGFIGRSTGMPAETFAEALHPIAQQNTTYNSILEDGEPVDAMRLTGPTDDVYVARMFGTASEDKGIIVIDRQIDTGWETLGVTGRWERNLEPFPRIDLTLPGGLVYADARIGYELGHAYLFERQGFLRHGWTIPKETNLDSLFGRRQVRYAFDQAAFDEMIDALDNAGILVEHPFYTDIIDNPPPEDDTGGGGNTK